MPSLNSWLRSPFLLALFALLLSFARCGSEMPKDMTPQPMEFLPPPAGQGVQFRMVSTIASGQEIERCQFVQAPPEGLNINHEEVHYTPGSHHVLLYATSYTTIPTTDRHGVQRDTSGVIDCPYGAGVDWNTGSILGGAQSFDGGSLVSLPPGVALKVPGGAVLLINTHYLNASPNDLVADARINVYTIPDAEVQHEGGVLFYYDPIIAISEMGRSSARMRCGIRQDIILTNIQSHMHRRGVNYVANLLNAGGQLEETLYTNTNWENVPVKMFQPGRKISAGSFVDYRCDYDNKEARTIIQGQSTRDEMCVLMGSYYPRNDGTALCAEQTFIGGGTKTCNESLQCSIAAILTQDVAAFYGCIVDSCEKAAAPLTAAVRCIATQNNGKCMAECGTLGSPACTNCIKTGCQPVTDFCAQTSCS